MKVIKSIILTISFIIISIFGLYMITSSKTYMKHIYKSNDIYNKTYEVISNKIDEFIEDDDFQKEILDYYNKDQVKTDINYLIDNYYDNNNVVLDYTNNIEEITKKYTSNSSIIDYYKSNINSIIKDNIFITKDVFNKIPHIKLSYQIGIILLMVVFNIVLIYLFNKKIVNIALYSTGLLFLITKLFLYIFDFYNHISYGNTAISMFITNYFKELFGYMMIIGLFIVIVSILFTEKEK